MVAKSSSSAVLLGVAAAAGGFLLWKKYGKATVTAITDSGATINVPVTSSGAIDTRSAEYATAVANGVQAYIANASTPTNCQMTPYGPVCPSNFNNPTLAPPLPVCGAGYKLNAGNTACEPIVCASGYRLNSAGTACETIPASQPSPVVTPPTPAVYDTGQAYCSNNVLYTRMSDGSPRQVGTCQSATATDNFECRGGIAYRQYTDGSWVGLGVPCSSIPAAKTGDVFASMR